MEEEEVEEEESGGEEYFEAYADVAVHELMIKDAPRMAAYRAAVEAAAEHIKGKVVCDVGCGTGILSLLCARAGARKVYAIENNEMALIAARVAEDNGFADVIEVVFGRVEDVELPEQADVLISEWMGFHLVHESMLESVLSCRDRLLKPGGLMLPGHARLFCAPVDLTASYVAEHFGCWADVLGFDMSALVPLAAQRALSGPVVATVAAAELLAAPQLVAELDCSAASAADARRLAGSLAFPALRSGVCVGYCLWFEVAFGGGPQGAAPVVLSTAPGAPATHWQQSVVFLPEMLKAEAGLRLDCRIAVETEGRVSEISLEVGEGGEAATGAGGASS